MKVAMVCPYSFSVPGGVQSHVLGLAEWLTAHDHEVAILAPGELDELRTAHHRLADGVFTSLGRPLPVRYNGSVARVTFGPLTQARTAAWLRGVRPDVIHVHEPITPSAAVMAVWARNAPVVATFHTATPGSRTMSLAGRLMPRTVAGISAGIAVSQVARRVVRDHIGLDPVVIGNGISVSDHPIGLRREARRGGPWRGGERPRITFLGRFEEPRKGFGVFERAMALVRRQWPEAEIVVAGDGRPRPRPGWRFVGRLDDAARNQLLATSDVYVAPHLGRESFGIVLLEALAAGCPVVASDLPAFLEVLHDGTGLVGRIFPAGDADALARAVNHTLTAPPSPQRGRRLSERFDWSQVAPRVLEVFDTARSGQATPRVRGIA